MRLILALTLLLTPLSRAADNQLTDQEKAAGWILLFDGQSNDGWVSDKTNKPVNPANIKDGALNTFKSGGYVPYYNKQKFKDFVLTLDVKVSKGCNSGVFLRVADPKDPVQTGFEIQVSDAFGKEKLGKHDMGALYDAENPDKNPSKPAGEWQQMQITCNGSAIEVVLNGQRVVHAELSQWREPFKNRDRSKNKFKTALKDMAREGYIGLQDHGHDCWYKNIKIRPLQ